LRHIATSSQTFIDNLFTNILQSLRAFITESSSVPEAEEETENEKSHTRKRERNFAVSSSFTYQQSTRFAAEQTRKENIGEPHQSLTHTRASLPASRLLYSLIVVFAGARAEEMLSKEIFRVSVLF
jgi:hypothetical protein